MYFYIVRIVFWEGLKRSSNFYSTLPNNLINGRFFQIFVTFIKCIISALFKAVQNLLWLNLSEIVFVYLHTLVQFLICTFIQFNLSKDCIFWTYVLKSVHNKKVHFSIFAWQKMHFFYYVNNLYWYFHMYIFISNIITAHSIWWKCSYKLKQMDLF